MHWISPASLWNSATMVTIMHMITCDWSNWYTHTKLNRRNVGNFQPLWFTGSENGLKRFFIYVNRIYCNFSNSLENPEGGPFYVKKIVSNFDKTQNIKSLWPKDFTHKIRISYLYFHQNRRQFFFYIEGSPLWIFQEIWKIAKSSRK